MSRGSLQRICLNIRVRGTLGNLPLHRLGDHVYTRQGLVAKSLSLHMRLAGLEEEEECLVVR